MMGVEMFSLPELADAIGVRRQSLWESVHRAKIRKRWPARSRDGLTPIPRPDAYTQSGRPLWKRSTLKRAGVLETVSNGKSKNGHVSQESARQVSESA